MYNRTIEISDELARKFLPIGNEIPITDGRRRPRGKRSDEESGKNALEKLLSVEVASKQCGVSRNRINAAINAGELAYYPIGKKARKVKASDINKWLETKRTFIGE